MIGTKIGWMWAWSLVATALVGGGVLVEAGPAGGDVGGVGDGGWCSGEEEESWSCGSGMDCCVRLGRKGQTGPSLPACGVCGELRPKDASKSGTGPLCGAPKKFGLLPPSLEQILAERSDAGKARLKLCRSRGCNGPSGLKKKVSEGEEMACFHWHPLSRFFPIRGAATNPVLSLCSGKTPCCATLKLPGKGSHAPTKWALGCVPCKKPRSRPPLPKKILSPWDGPAVEACVWPLSSSVNSSAAPMDDSAPSGSGKAPPSIGPDGVGMAKAVFWAREYLERFSSIVSAETFAGTGDVILSLPPEEEEEVQLAGAELNSSVNVSPAPAAITTLLFFLFFNFIHHFV